MPDLQTAVLLGFALLGCGQILLAIRIEKVAAMIERAQTKPGEFE